MSATHAASDRFPALDGLRGIAAVAVVWLHCEGSLFGHYGLASHAYLAVDLFFCLSGFVIAHRYDRRLAEGMPVGAFLRARVVRLYPMLLLGVLLGAGIFVTATGGTDFAAMSILTLATMAMMPVGLLYGREAFFLDNPMWSLFFEFAAYLVYAAKHRVALPVLVGFAAIGATAIVIATMLNGGMSDMGFLTPAAFMLGFVRVAYPFAVGVILSRLRGSLRLRIHPVVPYAILATMLFVPVGRSWAYDLVAILFVVPAIVAASVSCPQASQLRVLTWLGAISYPLYLLHEPILRIALLGGWPQAQTGSGESMVVAVMMIVAASASAIALRCYDEPVRRRFARRGSQVVGIGIGRDGIATKHTLV